MSGRDYWTVDQIIQHLTDGLPSFNFSWSHLTRVWNWKGLSAFDIPPLHGLARVHCVNIFRNRGIWVKWKQYMTSEYWSRPVLLIPPHEMPALAAWRPDQVVQEWSPNDQTSKLAWVNKLEKYLERYFTIWGGHELPKAGHSSRATIFFTDGPSIEQAIHDLKAMSFRGPGSLSGSVSDSKLPPDILAQHSQAVTIRKSQLTP